MNRPIVTTNTLLFWREELNVNQFKKFNEWLKWRVENLQELIEAVPTDEATKALIQRAIGEKQALETLTEEWIAFLETHSQQEQ